MIYPSDTFRLATDFRTYGPCTTCISETYTVRGDRVLIDDNAGTPFWIALETARTRWTSKIRKGWKRIKA